MLSKKLILFRVDASEYIGSGHVMRCLALATQLKVHGYDVIFLSRFIPKPLIDVINNNEINVHLFSNHFDEKENIHWLTNNEQLDGEETLAFIQKFQSLWVVVDHYHLGSLWESIVTSSGCYLLAIDDLANRAHDCNLLLDQNTLPNMLNRYKYLGASSSNGLFGANFALLRQPFFEQRKNLTCYQERISHKK